jgi:tetratricopeptide (TPR) repeat protein
MKHIVRFFATALLCASNILCADSFKTAVDSYHESKYEQAIEHFKAALAEGESAPARHNLALSYFQSNQLGEATWQLERAVRLKPLNTSYQFKLGALRQQLGLYQQSTNWWQSASSVLSINTWILLLTISFWLIVALLLLPSAGQMSRTLPVKLSTTASFILLSLSTAAISIHYFDMPDGVVISNQPTTVRHAPASAAPSIARPGERLQVNEHYQGFVKVETEANIVGWLPEEDFRVL